MTTLENINNTEDSLSYQIDQCLQQLDLEDAPIPDENNIIMPLTNRSSQSSYNNVGLSLEEFKDQLKAIIGGVRASPKPKTSSNLT